MTRFAMSAAAIAVCLAGCQSEEAPVTEARVDLRPELYAFQRLAGACWYGEFPGGEQIDVHCFDAMYHGQYVRDVHAVPGEDIYRGETIYHWDLEASVIRFRYYNSIGGVSDGTAHPEGDTIRFPDERHTGEDGSEMVIASSLHFDREDSYLAISTDVTDPDNPRELFTIRFERITRERADELVEGGL